MSNIIKIIVALLVGAILATAGIILTSKESTLGALAGPDIPYPYLQWGGIRTYNTAASFTTATTTVCAIQSPTSTSTLVSAGVRFAVSSTTASLVTLAKATTAFATTTIIGNAIAIAANTQDTIIASTTDAQVKAEDHVFAPNEWFVVGMQGGTGTFSPSGTCQAQFQEII